MASAMAATWGVTLLYLLSYAPTGRRLAVAIVWMPASPPLTAAPFAPARTMTAAEHPLLPMAAAAFVQCYVIGTGWLLFADLTPHPWDGGADSRIIPLLVLAVALPGMLRT